MNYAIFFKNISFYSELCTVLFFSKTSVFTMNYALFFKNSSFFNELYTVRLGAILRPFWHRAGPAAEQSRAEPSRAEPSRAEPSRAGPGRAEPSRAEKSSDWPACWQAGWLAGLALAGWPWLAGLAGPGWLGEKYEPQAQVLPMRPQQFRLGPKIHVWEQTRAFWGKTYFGVC